MKRARSIRLQPKLLLGLVALSLSVSGVPSRYLQLVELCFTALHGIIAP